MCSLKILPLALVLGAMPLAGTAQQLTNQNDVLDKIVAQEQAEVRLFQQYAPLVETYIQYLRADNKAGAIPHGDKYFLGRAKLASGVELEPLDRPLGLDDKLFGGLKEFFTAEFVPRGFLQMIYVDAYGLDRSHYRFEYVRRDFLGEVRCLVFDIDPLPKTDKGRFVGRICVEDQDYHIVRFNGTYGGPSLVSNYFNFDSWRINAGKNLWLPAFIYAEEASGFRQAGSRRPLSSPRSPTRRRQPASLLRCQLGDTSKSIRGVTSSRCSNRSFWSRGRAVAQWHKTLDH